MTSSAHGRRRTRRQVLRGLAAAAGGIAAAPYVITSTALGGPGRAPAGERIVMGAIGLGRRGPYNVRALMSHADVQMVAVCDVQRDCRDAARDQVDKAYGSADCKAYIDLRGLLARDDIDAVMIATGDNWQAPAAILAARAGKDMYCEKPMALTIAESRAVVDAVRRYGTVYQCGTHRRSVGQFHLAVQIARSGRLGRLSVLHAEKAPWWVDVYEDSLPPEPAPPRDVVDWDTWLGPAPWRPYNSRYHTRMFWGGHRDFAGGAVTEWGCHTADLCQWANDADDTSPVEYELAGGTVHARYANGVRLVFDQGTGPMRIRIEGAEGWVTAHDDGGFDAHPKSLLQLRRQFPKAYWPADHVRNFLDCVKTRREPTSPARIAHRSFSACHCANVALRLSRSLRWDPRRQAFIGDDEANRLLGRAYREPWRL